MIVVGNSLNDYTTLESSQKFQTIHDATSLVQPGFYKAKVDLKSAYRSIRVSEMSQQFTGLQIALDNEIIYLYEKKLPFSCRLALGICSIV